MFKYDFLTAKSVKVAPKNYFPLKLHSKGEDKGNIFSPSFRHLVNPNQVKVKIGLLLNLSNILQYVIELDFLVN